jgi:hypothetical protein
MSNRLGRAKNISFECEDKMASSQLLCLSHPSASSSHRCRSSERYLVFRRTGRRLSFERFLIPILSSTYWGSCLQARVNLQVVICHLFEEACRRKGDGTPLRSSHRFSTSHPMKAETLLRPHMIYCYISVSDGAHDNCDLPHSRIRFRTVAHPFGRDQKVDLLNKH